MGSLVLTRAVNVNDLAVLVEAGGVAESEEDTAGRPGELVAKRVVGVLGGGKTTAVREEGQDLATLLVDLLDGLDGVWARGVSIVATGS